jgi:hypothetical protein
MESSDISQVGISASNHDFLQQLKSEGVFAEMVDAYRFAIGMAIAADAKTEPITKRENMYSRATVDENGTLEQVLRLIYPQAPHPYRLMEMLADWGLKELRRLHATGQLDLAQAVREAEEPAQ